MYLGIDFLISPEQQPFVVDVNIGLPGGAQEYFRTHLVHFGVPSDIFRRIEETSQRVHGKSFREYIDALPHIESLKPFKIWMDGRGPLPKSLHPALRLEDKWIQYQLIHPLVPMPETMIFDPRNPAEGKRFLERKGKAVVKRRLGRGGRNLEVIDSSAALSVTDWEGHAWLLQEFIESKINGYSLSIRAVAFGGKFMCMYANLSTRPYSNHGVLTFVSPGNRLGLADRAFATESFNQKSWEAELWFGKTIPPYLQHNLYEDEVAKTTLSVPEPVFETIKAHSVRIERFYEELDFSILPKACFEEEISS
jgi:hypothetical protein